MKINSNKRIKTPASNLPYNLCDYLTVREAAEFLGVSTATLRRWDAAGRLKAFRHPLNRYRLYRTSDLRKLLSQIEQKQVVIEK
jgi:excisionase family DNA binding protein